MKDQQIRASSVQFQSVAYDIATNLETVARFVQKAAKQQTQVIAFPECCLTGYWCLRNLPTETLTALAERVPDGKCTQALLELSRRHEIIIGAGLIEVDEHGTLFNSYIVTLPDGSVHCHRKLHAFIHPDVKCGDSFTVFETHLGVTMGVLICYDNNIVENARMNALMGAELLLAPHQTGGTASRSPHAMKCIDPALWNNRKENPWAMEAAIKGPSGRGWLMRWLPARAHDNGMFILFSNGIGLDDDEVRTGNAMILDPYGRVLAETWKADDDMVHAVLDLSLIESSTGRRWLKVRRPELYTMLMQQTGIEAETRAVRFGEAGTSS